MSDEIEPDGAVDHSFDDAERDARELIADKLGEYNRDIRPNDIAIDLVQGRPVFVKKKAAPDAATYFGDEDFDVATYKTNPFLPVDPDDPVFTAVYVPTKAQDLPSEPKDGRTYDFPRGRLMRVPIEWLWGGDEPPFEAVRGAFLATMFATASTDANRNAVDAVARAAFDDATVDAAKERAGIGDDSLGDFD